MRKWPHIKLNCAGSEIFTKTKHKIDFQVSTNSQADIGRPDTVHISIMNLLGAIMNL